MIFLVLLRNTCVCAYPKFNSITVGMWCKKLPNAFKIFIGSVCKFIILFFANSTKPTIAFKPTQNFLPQFPPFWNCPPTIISISLPIIHPFHLDFEQTQMSKYLEINFPKDFPFKWILITATNFLLNLKQRVLNEIIYININNFIINSIWNNDHVMVMKNFIDFAFYEILTESTVANRFAVSFGGKFIEKFKVRLKLQ